MLGRVDGKTLATASSSVQRDDRMQIADCGLVMGKVLMGRNPTRLVRVVEETMRRAVSSVANVDLGRFRICGSVARRELGEVMSSPDSAWPLPSMRGRRGLVRESRIRQAYCKALVPYPPVAKESQGPDC